MNPQSILETVETKNRAHKKYRKLIYFAKHATKCIFPTSDAMALSTFRRWLFPDCSLLCSGWFIPPILTSVRRVATHRARVSVLCIFPSSRARLVSEECLFALCGLGNTALRSRLLFLSASLRLLWEFQHFGFIGEGVQPWPRVAKATANFDLCAAYRPVVCNAGSVNFGFTSVRFAQS